MGQHGEDNSFFERMVANIVGICGDYVASHRVMDNPVAAVRKLHRRGLKPNRVDCQPR